MQLLLSLLDEEGNSTEANMHSVWPFEKMLNMLSVGTW